MRTIVDIPEDAIKLLDSIGKRDDVSRAELVRRAVDLYLAEERKKKSDDAIDKYCGFLKDAPDAFDGLDGLDYQRKMRAEWDDRDREYGQWGFQESPPTPFEGRPKTLKD